MNAGELRHIVEIQSPVAEQNGAGEAVVSSWTTELETRAGIRPASAREMMQTGGVAAQVTHTITMRFASAYVPESGDRVRKASGEGERLFQIAGVVNVDERDVELRLLCYEQPDARAGGGA